MIQELQLETVLIYYLGIRKLRDIFNHVIQLDFVKFLSVSETEIEM